jgi:aminoglycoside phosphotransferase (APT) family kinase protein
MGPGARIVSVRRLRGGSSSAVHALDVETARGRHRLVLRRFTLPAWQEPEGAEREARILDVLKGSGVPAPELIAIDANAEACDVPALLMTRLPGRLDLRPRDMGAWLARLAGPLPAIHSLAVPAGRIPPYQPYYDPSLLTPPSWTAQRDAWRQVVDLLAGPRPASADVFVHRDYHPANILWSRGRISGIVDWTDASIGPAEVDVAHCRLDLACLFGVASADEFLEAHQTLLGRSAAAWHPCWDALRISESSRVDEPDVFPGWQGVGAEEPTRELVKARLDEYAVSIAARC